VLETYGEEITKNFYSTLFSDHPGLFNVFNRTNQLTGRQPRALAQTVLGAAKYINNLGALTQVVALIAYKHKSLGVLKEHYPIVGEYLLKAIKAVLKENVTDEILNAWGIYYGVLAEIFISTEEKLYQESESMTGGWRYTKEFKITKKIPESKSITSFYMEPVSNDPVPLYHPGQYVVVTLQIPDDQYISNRQYSLTDLPNEKYYRISVKREKEDDKLGVISNYLHDHVNVGDVVKLHAPSGDFVFHPTEDPIVLLAGGIGLNPLISMLKYLASHKKNQKVTLVHAVKPGQLYFFDEIMELKNQMPNLKYIIVCSKEMEKVHHIGRINEEWIVGNVLNLKANYYVCGPIGFMQDIIGILKEKGVEQKNIFYEFFGPYVPF